MHAAVAVWGGSKSGEMDRAIAFESKQSQSRKGLEITRKEACRELPHSSSPLHPFSVHNTDSEATTSHAYIRTSKIHASVRLVADPRNSTKACRPHAYLTGRSTYPTVEGQKTPRSCQGQGNYAASKTQSCERLSRTRTVRSACGTEKSGHHV